MAGRNHNYTSIEEGQGQMHRDDLINQPSDLHSQGQANTSFLQETGTQVKNMAQGAADIGKGALNIARGAAIGAANIAQGAAGAVKNTLGGPTNESHAPPNTTTDPSSRNNYPTNDINPTSRV